MARAAEKQAKEREEELERQLKQFRKKYKSGILDSETFKTLIKEVEVQERRLKRRQGKKERVRRLEVGQFILLNLVHEILRNPF